MKAIIRLGIALMVLSALVATACGGNTASDNASDESNSAANDQEQTNDSSSSPDVTTGDSAGGNSSSDETANPSGDGDGDVTSESSNDAQPPPALSVDEAIASLGAFDGPWPGPIFTQYVCENLPAAHIEAVVPAIPAGRVFEYQGDGTCRVSTGNSAIVIKAIGTEVPLQEYARRKELLSGDQAVTGYGDEAVEVVTGVRQAMLLLDGDIVWQIEGGDPREIPADQFHALVDVLLTRFDPATRVDAVAEPLTADELAQLTKLLEDWHSAEDAYFDDLDSENDLRRFATEQAVIEVVGRRRSNQSQLDEGRIGGSTYQIQQLETVDASWFRATSRGDVLVVVECVLIEYGQPEGRDPITAAGTQTRRVLTSGDQWLVDVQVEGSGSTAEQTCT